MATKAEYQYYSSQCLRCAAGAKTEEERQAFLEMADAWTRIALVQHDVSRQIAADANEAKQRPHS